MSDNLTAFFSWNNMKHDGHSMLILWNMVAMVRSRQDHDHGMTMIRVWLYYDHSMVSMFVQPGWWKRQNLYWYGGLRKWRHRKVPGRRYWTSGNLWIQKRCWLRSPIYQLMFFSFKTVPSWMDYQCDVFFKYFCSNRVPFRKLKSCFSFRHVKNLY